MLTREQAYAKLDEHKEGWLALAVNHGLPFSERAAWELLDGVPSHGWDQRQAQYWMLRSAMSRGDKERCRQFVNDWSARQFSPSKTVHKFVPGDHYHVMNVKFDTLDEAICHLEGNGYRYGGLEEKHVYREE